MKRRSSLLWIVCLGVGGVGILSVAGCGFKLRSSDDFAFASIAVAPNPGGPLAMELRRTLGSRVRVLRSDEDLARAQLVIDVLHEQREKRVAGVNSSGQIREYQLHLRLKFRVRTPQGHELLPETEIVQQRDISFNESAALAKEAEETLLYRDMQIDIVQQVMRRLARVRLG